jgi:hypothetical protein
MKRLIVLSIVLLSIRLLHAQKLDINLTRYPYALLTVSLKNGTQIDTVYNASLDDKGRAEVVIPEKHVGFRGMATLKCTETWFDFIVAGENFNLTCNEEYLHGNNVVFTGSPENESLQKWFFERQNRRQKIAQLEGIRWLYSENDTFLPLLEKEKEKLESNEQEFEAMLRKSSLYAAQFIRLYTFMDNQLTFLAAFDSTQMSRVRNYVRCELDINSLYTSGLWFNILNGLLPLYANHTPYHKDYVADMSLLLEHSNTTKIYSALAEDLLAICEATGWNDIKKSLTRRFFDDRRINLPTEKIN